MKLLLILVFIACKGIVDSAYTNSCDKTGSKEYKENQTPISNPDSNVCHEKIIEEHKGSNRDPEITNRVPEKSEIKVILPYPRVLNCFENATLWAEKEEMTFQLAKLRHNIIKEEVATLEAYIHDYESATDKTSHHSRQHLESPKFRAEILASSGIASYRFTYRYVHMLQRLKEIMAKNSLDKQLHDILWKNNIFDEADGYVNYFFRPDGFILQDWPNLLDLGLAMHSLISTQEIYEYDYNDLPSMLCPETKKPPQLNAFHCAQIGMHAMRTKHFALAIEWMEHSADKVNNENDASIHLPLLESYIEFTVKMHNWESLSMHGPRSKYFRHLFVNIVQPFQSATNKEERVSNDLLKVHRGHKKPGYEHATFKGICSGEDYRTVQELSNLNCWYDTSSNPARTIQPFKKELLSSEPEIVQVHEFVGAKLISKLLNDKTNRSGAPISLDKSKPFRVINRFKTPTYCWPVHSKLESLWNKVSSLTHTDLRTEAMSHDVRSVDYLSGRYYIAHKDSLQSAKDNKEIERKLAENGDTLFTMVVYLNDVFAGGWTPFPGAGTAARPIKGSVVFWNNLYRNGSARENTWYGACPVTYGHKQVAVVHIRSHSQFLTHPCTLNKSE